MNVEWHRSEIGGREVRLAEYLGFRLYICDRFGRVEAWVDGEKLGDYADHDAATESAVKRAEDLSLARSCIPAH